MSNLIRRAIIAIAMVAGIAPAIAQVPPPVPALPDAERRTSYSITSSTCACNVNFALYGDSTDYQNWVEVFVNEVRVNYNDAAFGWTITSPSGQLSSIARPITDAVLTFNSAQTGTIQIVGARRPRRTSQFQENVGVPTRNFNVVLSDIIAQNREIWDKTNDMTGRGVFAPPGETLALLPVLASRQNMGACFDNNGNLTSCISVPSGSIAAGAGIMFTGTNPTTISNNIAAGTGIAITGTNPLVISSVSSAVTYTPPWTGAVAYPQSKFNANAVYMTDFMGTTTCDGTTDQYANMQAFLTQLSANGVAGKSVTGVLAPGNCFVSGGTPTLTLNSSTLVRQIYLLGYGTTITPDPSKALDGLLIARGTLVTLADEQSGITVEGVTINAHNNSNMPWGIEFTAPHTSILRTQCIAGDDGTIHNQVNLACIYGHQSDPFNSGTGPFWSRVIGNVIKGNGVAASALPNCMRFDGQVNALLISQNTCNEALVGILIDNACASVTADCAAQANGVEISSNAFEALSEGINFITSVPSLTALARWNIHDNRVENVSVQFIDLSHITQPSTFPITIGADMLIGTSIYVFNPNSISFNKLNATATNTGLTTWP